MFKKFFSKKKKIENLEIDKSPEISETENIKDLKKHIEDFLFFLPLPFAIINSSGIAEEANQAFLDLTGYKIEEISSLKIEKLFDNYQTWDYLESKISKERIVRGEDIVVLTKNGRKIPTSLWASSRKNIKREIIGYFISFSDITEVKELQEKLEEKVRERTKELKESEKILIKTLNEVEAARSEIEEERRKTVAAFTNIQDGLLIFNHSAYLSLINPQAENILDVKREQVLGKHIFKLNPFEKFRPLVSLFGPEIKSISKKEILLNGLVVEVSSIPMMIKGEKAGSLIVLRDITREKMVEKTKAEFVTLAAHQLRTPTSAIKWSLRMLLDGDRGEITPDQKEAIEKTYKTNDRVIYLINNLLNADKAEDGKYISETKLSSIEEVINLAIEEKKEEIERKKINLKIKKEEKIPMVMLDTDGIRLAIDNFLDNAVRYTSSNGNITIYLWVREKELEVHFEDNGMGVPLSQQSKLFTKFFRGSNIMKVDTEGSGLGLFIAKNIIEAHGGRTWFQTQEGKGSIFSFSLPIKEKFSEYLKKDLY